MDWNKEYFYHYTSFESAIKIIASRKLLFSKINKLNDINESCGPIVLYHGLTDKEVRDKEELLSKYIQVSLTMDCPNCRGFDIPAMWGHYASRGSGVCLVLDKERFIESVNEPCLYHREVIYSPISDLNDITYYNSRGLTFDDFVRNSKDELFFHKTSDWAYEQEYRIIAISDEIKSIPIASSLTAVMLYNRKHANFLHSIEYRSLSKIGQDLEFYRYAPGLVGSYNLFDVGGNNLREPLKFDLSITEKVSETND